MDTSKVFLVKRGVPPSVDYGHQEKDGQITLPFSFVTVGKLYLSKMRCFQIFLCVEWNSGFAIPNCVSFLSLMSK